MTVDALFHSPLYHPSLNPLKLTSDDLKRMEEIMEEMANAPREKMGERQSGEYQASEPCYQMINNLQWALDFINSYEKKHKK